MKGEELDLAKKLLERLLITYRITYRPTEWEGSWTFEVSDGRIKGGWCAISSIPALVQWLKSAPQ